MAGTPKLVSTYFGDRGSFAFDRDGSFCGSARLCVVVEDRGADRIGHDPEPEFLETLLPWAYLCILNSGVFENLLEGICPRVQGGQFNLSSRFVNRVYLPDLSNELQVTGSLVEELATCGRQIHAGKMPDLTQIDEAAARAYGLPQ